MSLSRRYGIILVAYHGSFHDGKELYTMSNVKRKDSKIAICVMERASEKTEDTFINIPIYTESHNLSILGNLYRQTRHLLESVMIYR